MTAVARALIVVDVQNDFCEGGSLAVPGGAAVARAISEYAGTHAGEYDLVVATRDWHVDPGPHFAAPGDDPDFAETWPVHCVAGTHGAAFLPDLLLPPGTLVFSKGEHAAAFSGFEGHDGTGRTLGDVLRAQGITDIAVAGIATSFCDRATALDGIAWGFRTTLLGSLCADVAGVDTAATLEELALAGVRIDR